MLDYIGDRTNMPGRRVLLLWCLLCAIQALFTPTNGFSLSSHPMCKSIISHPTSSQKRIIASHRSQGVSAGGSSSHDRRGILGDAGFYKPSLRMDKTTALHAGRISYEAMMEKLPSKSVIEAVESYKGGKVVASGEKTDNIQSLYLLHSLPVIYCVYGHKIQYKIGSFINGLFVLSNIGIFKLCFTHFLLFIYHPSTFVIVCDSVSSIECLSYLLLLCRLF
uniref:Uncharacterized protein n=1 Tax=Ditylum brightwellii TaxID=49249 RepID=A0A7S4W819_9STRA